MKQCKAFNFSSAKWKGMKLSIQKNDSLNVTTASISNAIFVFPA